MITFSLCTDVEKVMREHQKLVEKYGTEQANEYVVERFSRVDDGVLGRSRQTVVLEHEFSMDPSILEQVIDGTRVVAVEFVDEIVDDVLFAMIVDTDLFRHIVDCFRDIGSVHRIVDQGVIDEIVRTVELLLKQFDCYDVQLAKRVCLHAVLMTV